MDVLLLWHEVNTRQVVEPHKIFGRNVAKLRYRAELTQEKLAEKADISLRYLQNIEAGIRQPRVNIIVKIRKGLGAEWHELFSGIP